eukprot:7694279-Heterocapsa_arctica.AAC.1
MALYGGPRAPPSSGGLSQAGYAHATGRTLRNARRAAVPPLALAPRTARAPKDTRRNAQRTNPAAHHTPKRTRAGHFITGRWVHWHNLPGIICDGATNCNKQHQVHLCLDTLK